MKIVVSIVSKISSRVVSLYLNVIRMSCSPNLGSPSNSIGMLNGTGDSISISSIYCVVFLSESSLLLKNRNFD